MVFNAKIAHRRQYKSYGDYFRVWEIESDMPKESVIEKCFSELHKTKLPEKKEWSKEIVYGARHFGDADYYFRGYYTIEEIAGGYKFTVCKPYDG